MEFDILKIQRLCIGNPTFVHILVIPKNMVTRLPIRTTYHRDSPFQYSSEDCITYTTGTLNNATRFTLYRKLHFTQLTELSIQVLHIYIYIYIYIFKTYHSSYGLFRYAGTTHLRITIAPTCTKIKNDAATLARRI